MTYAVGIGGDYGRECKKPRGFDGEQRSGAVLDDRIERPVDVPLVEAMGIPDEFVAVLFGELPGFEVVVPSLGPITTFADACGRRP
ncbi:hypothetical protein C446_01910 [Halobiforma nitratireducens JCM 10879]|uniref:Uncharacterized protein n=1 Tax=Halobiforma nitratireducens JCM 10879 TaxID=1227454 RepID=M0MJ40_9EURY|nr:hypothetical protein C446_01910 [Halobiforma nitratireducens JCM 10879]